MSSPDELDAVTSSAFGVSIWLSSLKYSLAASVSSVQPSPVTTGVSAVDEKHLHCPSLPYLLPYPQPHCVDRLHTPPHTAQNL